MKVFCLLPVILFCIVLGGCSRLLMPATIDDNYNQIEPAESVVKVVIKSQDTALDELRIYSNYFHGLTAAERSGECKSLTQTLKIDDNLLNRMRIVLVLSLDPECGKPVEAIKLLKPILDGERDDSLYRWFSAYQMALLERMQSQEGRLAMFRIDLESVTTDRGKLKKKLEVLKSIEKKLKKKLEALKSIEKSINKRKGMSEDNRK